MDDERGNLLARREIVSGYLKALEHPEELLRVCANVTGGYDSAATAVSEAFGVSDIIATAILDLQVRRFTPHALRQMREELSDYDRRLRDIPPTGS